MALWEDKFLPQHLPRRMASKPTSERPLAPGGSLRLPLSDCGVCFDAVGGARALTGFMSNYIGQMGSRRLTLGWSGP